MTTIAYSPVNIQTSAASVPSIPAWFGEITLMVHHLQHQGVLAEISEQVRFARRRFGRYELIDFLAVLFGYAISGERTLEGFYERLQPWESAFMALFGRDRLPARSTLSRFLAALDQSAVESLRTLFLKDLLARPLEKEEQPGGLFDRQGNHFLAFDVDGTREAARQRALPHGPLHSGAYAPCVLPATPDASEERSCGAVPRFCRRIRISFSARLETPAMGNTEPNCVGQSRPYKATERPITTPKNVFCSASTGNMAREPSSLISLGCLL
jgi:hypothetical protein